MNTDTKSGEAPIIAIVGFSGAGKTTLLAQLATGQLHTPRPTFNPNVEELQLGSLKVKTIDLGGHPEARRLWKEYLIKVDGVVFLVDASTPERFEESKAELDKLLQTDRPLAMLDALPVLRVLLRAQHQQVIRLLSV